ncbi:hypothetical protein LPJ56_005360, partial [Coemansia sp. RSA 2599]
MSVTKETLQTASEPDRENTGPALRLSSRSSKGKTDTIGVGDGVVSNAGLDQSLATNARKDEASGAERLARAASDGDAPSASASSNGAAAKRLWSVSTADDVAIEIESDEDSVYHSFVSAEQPAAETSPEAAPASGPLSETTGGASAEPAPRTGGARSSGSWWHNIVEGMGDLAPYQKTMITLRLATAFIRIVAGIVVLAVSAYRHEHAQRPLQAYIIMYISRLAAFYPLYFNRKVHRFGASWPNARMAKVLKV